MRQFAIRRPLAFILAIALVLLLSPAAPAAASPAVPTSDDLAGFLDPIFARQLAEYNIPGAVVVVVNDGEILYKQGYGFANLEQQVPFDPDRTLFTIGSVTKLFTATAVMQQVEQGRLDLHTDVNRYLTGLQVPSTYPEPITPAHLLTHTAGFDDQTIGWIATSPDEVEPLKEHLTRYLPPRIRPPGQMSQYNNHGISLAGHLVEEVTGLAFPKYLASHIWEPLGMTHTTYRPSTEVAPEIATGYMSLTGQNQPGQRVYFNIQPAGGIWTTATDMAAFMLAHLENGAYQGRRILAASTVADMHQQHFTTHPEVSGHAYGFFEHRVSNRRGLQHGGEDPEGFSSQLYLLPDEGVGIFVSYNKLGAQVATSELIQAFLDRYDPVDVFDDAPAEGAAESVERFAGSYKWIRLDRHSFARPLIWATTYSMQVRAEADGVLTTSTSGLASFMPETRWIQVEPLVFREAGGTATMAFDQDERGRITRLYLGWPQPLTMERLRWYEMPAFHLGLLLFCFIAFVPVIGWPVAGLYRRLRRRPSMSPTLRLTRLVGGLVGGLTLLFLLGLPVAMLATFLGKYTVSPAIRGMLWVPILITLLTVPLVTLVVLLWRRREGSMWVRLQHTLMALAALLLVPFLAYWRLLGFHF